MTLVTLLLTSLLLFVTSSAKYSPRDYPQEIQVEMPGLHEDIILILREQYEAHDYAPYVKQWIKENPDYLIADVIAPAGRHHELILKQKTIHPTLQGTRKGSKPELVRLAHGRNQHKFQVHLSELEFVLVSIAVDAEHYSKIFGQHITKEEKEHFLKYHDRAAHPMKHIKRDTWKLDHPNRKVEPFLQPRTTDL